eukprot:6582771-Prymnesium_polylepis.2
MSLATSLSDIESEMASHLPNMASHLPNMASRPQRLRRQDCAHLPRWCDNDADAAAAIPQRTVLPPA